MNITYTKYCYVNVRICVKQYKQHKEKTPKNIPHNQWAQTERSRVKRHTCSANLSVKDELAYLFNNFQYIGKKQTMLIFCHITSHLN